MFDNVEKAGNYRTRDWVWIEEDKRCDSLVQKPNRNEDGELGVERTALFALSSSMVSLRRRSSTCRLLSVSTAINGALEGLGLFVKCPCLFFFRVLFLVGVFWNINDSIAILKQIE